MARARPLGAESRRCGVDERRAGGTKHLFRGCCPRNNPSPQRETGPRTSGWDFFFFFLRKIFKHQVWKGLSILRRKPLQPSRTFTVGGVLTETSAFFSDHQVSSGGGKQVLAIYHRTKIQILSQMAYDQVSAIETENTGAGREPTGVKSQIYGQVEPLVVPEVNGANSTLYLS